MSNKIGFALVRDKNGKPRIDGDPSTLHPGVVSMLTPAEREELGIWPGVLIRDADGIKRGKLVQEDETTAVVKVLDDLRAAGDFYIGTRVFQLATRQDVPAGTTMNISKKDI